MTWASIGALAGLAGVALPILLHMMERSPAQVRRFPSLRFLAESKLLPLRRTRIHDPLLLAVRALVVVAAALALAGPGLNTDAAAGSDVERAVVVIVDTSASVGTEGRAIAREVSDSAIDGAAANAVVQTAFPGRAIGPAANWLVTQPGRPEIVVVSDFQLGAIDSADLRGVPPGTALSWRRVPIGPLVSRRIAQGGAELVATALHTGGTPETATVTWERRAARADAQVEILASRAESSGVAIARGAARVVGAPVGEARSGAVAVVYPGFAGRTALLDGAAPLHERWQGEVVARLMADSLLAGALLEATSAGDTSNATVVGRNGAGDAILSVAADRNASRMLLLVHAPAASEVAVALHASLSRAIAVAPPPAELEPATLSPTNLEAVRMAPRADAQAPSQRQPTTVSAISTWLWLMALALLTAEWFMRRRVRHAA